MKTPLKKNLRRFALFSLLTLGSLGMGSFGMAPLASDNIATAYEREYCHGEFNQLDASVDPSQWCGWATHDSLPMARAIEQNINAETTAQVIAMPASVEPGAATRTSCDFHKTLATIAATATGTSGLSLQQFVEPFAMVGTYRPNSVDQVRAFDFWWETFSTMPLSQSPVASAPQAVPQSDAGSLQSQLNFLAMSEPIDVAHSPGDNAVAIDRISVKPAKKSTRVGSAAFIVSLDEAYLPYDLSRADLLRWQHLGTINKPYCLRNAHAGIAVDPMWNDHPSESFTIEAAVETKVVSGNEKWIMSSADCLLDEWIYKVESALDEGATLRQAMRPDAVGAALASLWSNGQNATARLTKVLARVWPEIPAKPAAARQLLARAEATESGESTEAGEQVQSVISDEQLAAMKELVRQWLSIAERTGETSSHR